MKLTPILDSLRLENISDAEYFSEKYAGYISNSRLKLIDPDDGGDPETFFEGLSANKIYSDSLILGSAVHMSQLQPESFFICTEVDRPTAKIGAIADILYNKEGNLPIESDYNKAFVEVDYYGGLPTANKRTEVKEKVEKYIKERSEFEKNLIDDREPFYLDPKARERYYGCCTALENNHFIQDLLHPKGVVNDPISANEQTILLDVKVELDNYEPFILRLKSKLDNYTIDTDSNIITVNDIKTTGKLVNEFSEAIERYRYMRELAMYSWLLSLCATKFYNMSECEIRGNFLVVSTIPQYYTKVVPMTKKLYKRGFADFKRLLELVAINYPKYKHLWNE